MDLRVRSNALRYTPSDAEVLQEKTEISTAWQLPPFLTLRDSPKGSIFESTRDLDRVSYVEVTNMFPSTFQVSLSPFTFFYYNTLGMWRGQKSI